MAKAVKTKKEAAKKEESGFFIVRTVRKATDTVSEKVKVYNDKYVSKALDKGKKAVKEVNDKYVAKNFEKGKETFKEYNEKYIVKNFEKGREYIDGPYKKLTKKVDDVLAKGREMEKDAWKKFDQYVENGRKYAYKIPMVETIEKRVSSSLNSLPGVINIPSKAEIEKLTLAMEALNSNIETLNKQRAV